MTSQISPSAHSARRPAGQAQHRADNGADIARVLVALGLLAFLASFDGADETSRTAAAQPARTGVAVLPP